MNKLEAKDLVKAWLDARDHYSQRPEDNNNHVTMGMITFFLMRLQEIAEKKR